jgi:hypothetical protein
VIVIVTAVLDPEPFPVTTRLPPALGPSELFSAKLEKGENELCRPDHNLNPARELVVHVRVVRPTKNPPQNGTGSESGRMTRAA